MHDEGRRWDGFTLCLFMGTLVCVSQESGMDSGVSSIIVLTVDVCQKEWTRDILSRYDNAEVDRIRASVLEYRGRFSGSKYQRAQKGAVFIPPS